MTFSTEARVLAHVEDVDIYQIVKICKFCKPRHIQFGYDYDRDALDGRHLYSFTADVSGHSADFCKLMEQMMS